ncbi:hypothetical protein Poli38472_014245 [Pythium oligandrum]|uniref:HECT-type E3 ubiquitin transferase n=1 Tax=Pythium oligandrum TaxID=41045 RepID=A0A8K1CJL8_PYTOL|nr:hypothetical protein Poli38472_014245 [Pythium oligandrum]|eukprot:TMW64128.1 hypothetical protein Poli38472_014245 [Pythium oligandrum]
MQELLAVGIVLGSWIAMVLFFWFFLRRGRRQRREISLHAPLHPESTVHRLDAALSQAEEGFNVCTGCGFENFKRSIFCMVCGEAIESPLKDPLTRKEKREMRRKERKKRRQTRGDSVTSTTTTSPSSPRMETLSSTNERRQRRARKRREWTRVLDTATGAYSWKHETEPMVDDEDGDASGMVMPSFLLRFVTSKDETKRQSRDTITIQIDATSSETSSSREEGEEPAVLGPIRFTVEQRTAELVKDTAQMRVELTEVSSASDAMEFPVVVDVTVADTQLKHDHHTYAEYFQRDFPTKLADFVATTSLLVVPPDIRHMKFHLDRSTVLHDSLRLLGLLQEKDVRVAFRIDFENEKGVDAGGVYREWFHLLNEAFIKPENGIFRCVDKSEQTFYLNPNSRETLGEAHLLYFLATGRLIGRALLEGNASGFHLCLPLLKLMLGQPVNFHDLEYFDPETYKNLCWLLENDGVGDLGLDFSVCEKTDAEITTVDLIPNGRNIPVTDENKLEYVHRHFRYLLVDSVSSQLYSFLRGLYEVIPPDLLLMFDAEELDFVLCGADEIEVDDWERNTKYTPDLYKQPVLTWFWEIVREMPNEYRRRLLQFATGSSRVPFAGFSALTSYDGRSCPFTLKGISLEDEGYIRSHACFNRLDLPRHTDREQLQRVIYAVLDTELHGFTTS